ncbi:hypothetical protein [Desulfoscipio geothermicus]|uniref:Uncharacterized protein n=1 Tax=Desulfoscipio geothermicus DSM 3669 TaxID=1121426 RepID=A0A1I6EIN6_9FIRM|nr:hypothetical protein [Desulfoscipio geothermicus]SFR17421.1 hypothetical protein SAMN05660706_1476 [Desulfoscipio geothermicus DSM 3669]
MSESERKFHEETTVITPGKQIKSKQTKIGKKKAKTTVFNDAETNNI